MEYLNTLKLPRLLPNLLEIKSASIVIPFRNINNMCGLFNGKRLIVDDIINERILEATVANGVTIVSTVLITRITLQPTDRDFTFIWHPKQFSVRLSFAMTVNKSRGQSLRLVAAFLQDEGFEHGQLYFSVSQTGLKNCFRVSSRGENYKPKEFTANIVYKEVLV